MTTRKLERPRPTPTPEEVDVTVELEGEPASPRSESTAPSVRPEGTRPLLGAAGRAGAGRAGAAGVGAARALAARAAAGVDSLGAAVSATPPQESSAVHERTAHGALVSQSRSGRYVLAFELASGGMATVFLARFEGAAGFSRPVALKRIHMHLSRDRRFVDMFLDEARISARLSHPNVCAVQDFGQDENGGYYLAMEYLAGETLAKVARAALRADDAAPSDPRYRRFIAHLLAEACEGLHAAHEARGADGEALEIVHRDVTPNNLFVTFDGAVKVVDFGIAKARDRVTHTDTGEFKGSLPYISPEHARSREADRRTDIWSLGVCAWELYAGRRLFKRSTPAETLYAVLEDPVPRLDAVGAGYADAIERALMRDPEKRFATARELGRALIHASEADGPRPGAAEIAQWMDELFPGAREARRTLVARTLRADPEGPAPQQGARSVEGAGTHARPSPRSRGLAIGLAALLALGVVGGIGYGVLGLGAGEAVERAAVERAAVERDAVENDAIERDAVDVVERDVVEHAPDGEGSLEPPPPAPIPELAETDGGDPPLGTASPVARSPARGREAPRARIEPLPTEPARTEAAASEARARPRSETRGTEARTESPVAEPRGEGTLLVVVPDGWAEVYDGGRRLGQTPLRATLPSGGHELEVRIEGHAPGRRVHADVRAGETSRVVVRAGE